MFTLYQSVLFRLVCIGTAGLLAETIVLNAKVAFGPWQIEHFKVHLAGC